MDISNRKKTYINRAILVLKQDGLRLSLEEVANKMGITKKTIYNHFSSKDELLRECILSIASDFKEVFAGLDDENYSAVENLRRAFKRIDEFFMVLSPIFLHDLMRLNPNQAMAEHLIGAGFFQEKMQSNLRQGIRTGLYREDIDVDFIGHYMAYSIFGFYINSTINNKPYISKTYFQDIIEYNLLAMMSENRK